MVAGFDQLRLGMRKLGNGRVFNRKLGKCILHRGGWERPCMGLQPVRGASVLLGNLGYLRDRIWRRVPGQLHEWCWSRWSLRGRSRSLRGLHHEDLQPSGELGSRPLDSIPLQRYG
jgi:hypothetical protein